MPLSAARRTSRQALRALFLLLASGGVAFAGPKDKPGASAVKKQCSVAYERTQAARKEGKLQLAHEQVLLCAQDACPKFIKTDCVTWLPEIEASQPTVVFEAHDRDDKDTSAVRVTLDGVLLGPSLDGKAVPLDAGPHVFRYEMDGLPAKEARLVIREGEKNRKLLISFYVPPPPPPPPPPPGRPTAFYVAAGAGAVGLATFAISAGAGLAQKGNLESSCAPRCAASDASSVRTKLVLGDVGLTVGLISAGVATFLYLRAPAPPADKAAPPVSSALRLDRLDLGPTRGGGGAMTFGGTF